MDYCVSGIRFRRPIAVLVCVSTLLLIQSRGLAQAFVNWETPHVHPLHTTPDGTRLLAVNTPDNRLEVFDITGGQISPIGSIPVGLDPVSVRARTNTEIWVVNHVSDSVSVVNLTTMNVVASIRTDDEPTDVVFAGAPQRAFVSCSQANTVQVFDPANLGAAATRLAIEGEDPRAMAVSADGTRVYVAIFESGNRSTILGGGLTFTGGFPPNAVSDPAGPYGGMNPPPNDGNNFRPAQAPGNPPPPAVGMIVKKDADDRWMDDNNGDWTALVSGNMAAASGRPQGWDLLDHDVAEIDTASLSVTYATGVMNLCMAMAVNPANGQVTVVGTEATNEVRFEPVVRGRFIRVEMGVVDADEFTTQSIVDLNSHLVYTDDLPFVPIPPLERTKAIGDPRGIVWTSNGTRGFVTGMGSNNVVVIDAAGNRVGNPGTINVGEGPTGVVLHESSNRLFVLNKFNASISVINTNSLTESQRLGFYDPSPAAIKVGRKHLYDTHLNSGLGHIACASCHVDGRMDRLAWDLGAPDGEVKALSEQNCLLGGCDPWHPMKGPMTTQTLQDIIGKEPHHWRGDRDGIEEFAEAFRVLQGDDEALPAADMTEFENFLATIAFPPNPFRNFDNTLPTSLPLPGNYSNGRFADSGGLAAGAPLPNGNAVNGLNLYRTGFLDLQQGLGVGVLHCVTCHTLPTGVGPDGNLAGIFFIPSAPGPNGERHHGLVSVDGSTNRAIKIPQIRNIFEKSGFEMTQTRNLAGFGLLHDGSVDSIARFVSEPIFNLANDQGVADLVAFVNAFSGSNLPTGSAANLLELPGPASKDAHAAVGWQTTLVSAANPAPGQLTLIQAMLTQANANRVGLVVKGRQGGIQRGYTYIGNSQFQSDRNSEIVTTANLQTAAASGSELTYTVVPKGGERRIGIDRDEDGFLNRDELDNCSDPANPLSVPGSRGADIDGDGDEDADDTTAFLAIMTGASGNPEQRQRADFNCDQSVNGRDIQPYVNARLSP